MNRPNKNRYAQILNAMSDDLVACYEKSVRVNLQEEALLLEAKEGRANKLKWIALLSLAGLAMTTIFTMLFYKQPEPIRWYVTFEAFFLVSGQIGSILYSRANRKCYKHRDVFQKLEYAREQVDPIEKRLIRHGHKTTRSSILENLKESARNTSALESLVGSLISNSTDRVAMLEAANAELQAKSNRQDELTRNARLFGVEMS